MADRPLRVCDVCNQADDHPRHVQPRKPVDGVMQWPLVRHMDCCAAQGCEICAATEKDYGGKRGQDLIDHLDELRA